MEKIKVCLADDHHLVRDGIKKLLEVSGKYEVVLDARHGQELLDGLKKMKELPRLALVDVSMPVMDGIETVREMTEKYPSVASVALSNNDDYKVVFSMIDSGAKGYLLKDCSPDYLLGTLERVVSDGAHYDSFVVNRIMEHQKEGKPAEVSRPNPASLALLSAKEIAFIQAACSDDTYKEIADKLNVSPRTVDGYRDTVFQKIGKNTRVALVLYAIENGLYHPRGSRPK